MNATMDKPKAESSAALPSAGFNFGSVANGGENGPNFNDLGRTIAKAARTLPEKKAAPPLSFAQLGPADKAKKPPPTPSKEHWGERDPHQTKY